MSTTKKVIIAVASIAVTATVALMAVWADPTREGAPKPIRIPKRPNMDEDTGKLWDQLVDDLRALPPDTARTFAEALTMIVRRWEVDGWHGEADALAFSDDLDSLSRRVHVVRVDRERA